MNQMERIAKMIASEPDPSKKQKMKDEMEQIFYIMQHYGKIPRSKLAKRLGMEKVALNNLIYDNGIHIPPPKKKKRSKIAKSMQNRRAYLRRLEGME